MSEGLISLKPTLYQQVAEEAWINGDGKISVEFAKQRWVVTGAAGTVASRDVSSEPIQELFGEHMSLVSIKRLAKIIKRNDGALAPLFRYSECRLPVLQVHKRGKWKKSEAWGQDSRL